MEINNTFESLLSELLTPIVEKAVDKAFARNQILFQKTVAKESLPDLMNIKMVAKYLHLAVPTIYGLVGRRVIPVCKKGKRLYFKKEDIEKWIGSGRKSTIEEIDENVRNFYAGIKRKSK